MIFRQLFDPATSTYTYLVADPTTREGFLIDPVFEHVARDLGFIRELEIQLKYTIETHTHADHVTGATEISTATGAKKVVGHGSEAKCADVFLADGETLTVGGLTLRAIATPGHTGSCMSYHVGDRVFTGDALLIRSCGRTDFQEGSPEVLFESIHQKLYTLPDETLVYPGHDYKGAMASTVGEEKRFNLRIKSNTPKEEFVETMRNLKLADPARIHEAVPANLRCGRAAVS